MTLNGEGAKRPFLETIDLTKKFGDFTALREVSLAIEEGEFVCFLGPSGCGKTTLLRAIAGLDKQTSGRIFQRGVDISDLPVAARDFGIVFQSYALFPNMTVAKNVGYGLVSQKMGRQAIKARVAELLKLVGLPDSAGKYPAALSGGQQQRVALARALATSPGMLLLDEPLSALDAKVRVRLRQEMKDLQQRLGITTIMVTHDQEEGLSMADQIVVMNHGIIEQIGTPLDVYRNPTNAYVADFVGSMNFLHGSLIGPGRVRVGQLELEVDAGRERFPAGANVIVALRPEDVAVRDMEQISENRFSMTIKNLEFLGSFCRANLAVEGSASEQLIADFSINLMRDYDLQRGHKLAIALPKDLLRLFPGERGGHR